MSKSPEEIKNFETKKELAYVAFGKVSYEGCHKIAAKALAYIQQLEANASQVQKALQDNGFHILEELLQAYSQVKAERDAAVKDMKKMSSDRGGARCGVCRYRKAGSLGPCERCIISDSWEWRGVPEKEENNG